MKKTIIFICFLGFFSSSASSQLPLFGIIKKQAAADTSLSPVLIFPLGESNSGGLAENSYASAPELAVRTLKIFNNTTNASFDFLNIGTNNLIGHVGLGYASSDAHGIELQLANRYEGGDFGGRDVRIVKAGQGGTNITMWGTGGTYTAESQTINPYDTAVRRLGNAINLFYTETGKYPTVEAFLSIGINTGPDEPTFKAGVIDLIERIRAEFPTITIRFYITQFQDIKPVYDSVIAEITTEVDGVFAINTAGFETSEVYAGASIHWGYTGMKQLSNSFIDLILSNL